MTVIRQQLFVEIAVTLKLKSLHTYLLDDFIIRKALIMNHYETIVRCGDLLLKNSCTFASCRYNL